LLLAFLVLCDWMFSYAACGNSAYYDPNYIVQITHFRGVVYFTFLPVAEPGHSIQFWYWTDSPRVLFLHDGSHGDDYTVFDHLGFFWQRDYLGPKSRSSPSVCTLGLPHWLFVLVFGLSPMLPFRRQQRRRKLGLCLTCGYDLRASKERCPECGTPIDERRYHNRRQVA
jgi:predicted RNA-binding Zn-ribbon protein involved in translation (DUF1610 family)